MKEELINNLTERALKYLDTAEAFANNEVPAFLKELLKFKYVEHLIEISYNLGVIALLIICALVCFFSYKKFDGTHKKEHYLVVAVVFGLASVFLAACSTIATDFVKEHAIKAYKAKNAPRVYLVDYFKEQ